MPDFSFEDVEDEMEKRYEFQHRFLKKAGFQKLAPGVVTTRRDVVSPMGYWNRSLKIPRWLTILHPGLFSLFSNTPFNLDHLTTEKCEEDAVHLSALANAGTHTKYFWESDFDWTNRYRHHRRHHRKQDFCIHCTKDEKTGNAGTRHKHRGKAKKRHKHKKDTENAANVIVKSPDAELKNFKIQRNPQARTLSSKTQRAQSINSRGSFQSSLPFTPEARQEAKKLLELPADKTEVIRLFDRIITRSMLKTMKPGGWLSDDIINTYIQLLDKRNQAQVKRKMPVPKIRFFGTSFWKILDTTRNFENIEPFLDGENIFDYDALIFPVYLPNHWTLGVVDLRKGEILYLDSLDLSDGQDFAQSVFDVIQLEYLRRFKKELPDKSKWRLTIPRIPKQKNTSDCGVFVCQYARYLAENRTFDFTHADMDDFRLQMVFQICKGRI